MKPALRTLGSIVYDANVVPFDTLHLINMHHESWDEAIYMKRSGLVGPKDLKHFKMFWHWGDGPKFSSRHQDRVYAKMGSEFYLRRLERVKAIRARYLESLVKPYSIGESK